MNLGVLLASAAAAIPPGRLGRLEVGAVPIEEGRLRVTVADDGQGMPPRGAAAGLRALLLHQGRGARPVE